MLIQLALRNGFTYRKLFHQLEEIVSELLRYLWEIPSDAHQSLSDWWLFVAMGGYGRWDFYVVSESSLFGHRMLV